MKILFITRKYPPSTGGMELFARDLSDALAAETEVKLIKWGGHGRLLAVFMAMPYLFVRSFMALMGGGIDVIHVQDGVLAPMGRVLSIIFRKPYVVVIHGLDITYTNPLFRAVVPPAAAKAAAVICISRAAADEAVKSGVPAGKIHVITLAVTDNIYGQSDRAEFLKLMGLKPDNQVLLTVGRLIKRKGVAWFINDVLPDLSQKFPGLVYVVAGEGKERPNIEAAIARHKLEKQVRLLGRAPAELVTAAYNGTDVFVMPNIHVPGDMEGFGLVLLEAALCARPVVATNFEGMREAVADGRNGRLVAPGDAAAFKDEITKFLEDKKAAEAFGRQARRFTLDNYQWDKIARDYIDIYGRL